MLTPIARHHSRVLGLGYSSGGVAVWDCSNLECWSEVLNLPTLDCAFDSKLRKQFRHGIDRVVGASVVPSPAPTSPESPDPLAEDRPLLAILARPASHQSSAVFLYSLRSHRIVSTVPVSGTAHRILTNRRFLVVSTTSPLALHVYQPTPSASGYAPAPFSPITDVLPSPSAAGPSLGSATTAAGPVFDLGSGGRLLAYASSSPVLSSTLSRAPARPGTGILAHRGQFDGDALSFGGSPEGVAAGFSVTVQDAEDMARRVGEGVRSGVAALRERGGSWLRGAGTASMPSTSGGGGSPYSRSAPQFGAGGLSPTTGRQIASAGAGTGEAASPAAGTVKVVDLAASAAAPAASNGSSKARESTGSAVKVVAHFRPYGQPLALVSFSPASTMLLVASAAGHSFDVFELKPSVPVGVSAMSSAASTASTGTAPDGSDSKVWHRYRLQRGFTPALAASASWSTDGRFVAVSTAKGTAHVWAVQPGGGGTPRLESHFAPQVSNADELAPLSVTLGSVARVRHPRPAAAAPAASPSAASADLRTRPQAPLPVAVAFVPKRDSAASALRPTPPRDRPTTTIPAVQDVLVLRPSTGSATLHRLTAQRAPPPATTPGAAAEAVRAGDVGRLASTAVSGLSQLMRSRGGALLGGAGGPGAAAGGGGAREGNGAWSVRCVGVAEWTVRREEGAGEVKEEVLIEKAHRQATKGLRCVSHLRSLAKRATDADKHLHPRRYSAFAEIETCSRSPLVLPRSIYQSQQFEFFALPADHARCAAKGLTKLPLRRLEMRSEVVIRQGDGSTSSDAGPSSSSSPHGGARFLNSGGTSSNSSSFEPASFDQPIKTAMHALLDFDQVAPGSPKLPPPTFPNGVPGKHGSWRDSIAIPRNVGPAAIESLGRVRQGLGRVKVPSGIMLPVSVGRRRSSVPGIGTAAAPSQGTVGGVTSAAYSSSISFDDEEAVFADRLEGSLSTACTSELGDGGKGVVHGSSVGAEDADEEDWGWDERVDEDSAHGREDVARRSESSGALAPLREMAPFEEDFDDLDLELAPSPVSLATAHKAPAVPGLAVPSPLALEPVDAEPTKAASTIERHLAPPVSVFTTSLDDSASPSTSPGSMSGFDATSAAPVGSSSNVAAHQQLLDRPTSSLSGIDILSPSKLALAAPTNGVGVGAGGLSSSSGGSTTGSMVGLSSSSSSSSKKKKKGRR